MLVLDTNVLIEIESHNQKIIQAVRKLVERFPSLPYITAPTYSEFFYGYMKKDQKKKAKALLFLESYTLLNTTKYSCQLLAEIKHSLEKQGKPIPLFDILIASIVLDRDATLLTMDEHFRNIESLKVIILER